VLQAAADIAAKHGVSLANVATRWVLEHASVAGVIIGARLGGTRPTMQKLFQFALDQEDHEATAQAYGQTTPFPGDCGGEYRKLPSQTASGDLSHHLDEMPRAMAVEPLHCRLGAERVLSGSEWEDIAGYCRAQRIGEIGFWSLVPQ